MGGSARRVGAQPRGPAWERQGVHSVCLHHCCSPYACPGPGHRGRYCGWWSHELGGSAHRQGVPGYGWRGRQVAPARCPSCRKRGTSCQPGPLTPLILLCAGLVETRPSSHPGRPGCAPHKPGVVSPSSPLHRRLGQLACHLPFVPQEPNNVTRVGYLNALLGPRKGERPRSRALGFRTISWQGQVKSEGTSLSFSLDAARAVRSLWRAGTRFPLSMCPGQRGSQPASPDSGRWPLPPLLESLPWECKTQLETTFPSLPCNWMWSHDCPSQWDVSRGAGYISGSSL